jgi:hypothetical protein
VVEQQSYGYFSGKFGGCGLDSSGAGKGLVADSCEYDAGNVFCYLLWVKDN